MQLYAFKPKKTVTTQLMLVITLCCGSGALHKED